MQHADAPNGPKDGIPPPEDKPPVNARFRERTDAERRLERLRRRVVEVCPRLLALGPRTIAHRPPWPMGGKNGPTNRSTTLYPRS